MKSIRFNPDAWHDFGWWAINNPKIIIKIWELITEISKSPFDGKGKPEPLKGNWKGYWSRRITQEHRIIYKVEATEIVIMTVKGHY